MKFRKHFAAASALCLMLTGTAALPALTVSAEETQAATSGTFGSITWEYDQETKTLTVSGTGSTGSYYDARSGLLKTDCPWSAFRDAVEKAVISEGITEIDWGLFAEHFNLKSVQLPDSLTAIDDCAFADCFSLTEINIPESVTEFGANAFYDTAWLKTQLGQLREMKQSGDAEYPLLILNDVLVDGTQVGLDTFPQGIISFSEPSGVKTIGGGAFRDAKGISTVDCWDATEIGNSAFEISDIKELLLGSQVGKIGAYACYQCPDLEKVTIYNAICQIYDSAFTFCNSSAGEQLFTGTIIGYDGSTAQAYAEKYGYAFESLGPVLRTLFAGDMTGDNEVGLEDVQSLLAYYTETVAGKNPLFAEIQKKAADVNLDEKVDIADVQYTLKYYTENSVAKKNLSWGEILK
ncbi:MAG: leucine-rich repeat protein [Oscillospiraceae bacterium]|nr:leucine-rich repeat protein [Oscillospiraceae bacterium]